MSKKPLVSPHQPVVVEERFELQEICDANYAGQSLPPFDKAQDGHPYSDAVSLEALVERLVEHMRRDPEGDFAAFCIRTIEHRVGCECEECKHDKSLYRRTVQTIQVVGVVFNTGLSSHVHLVDQNTGELVLYKSMNWRQSVKRHHSEAEAQWGIPLSDEDEEEEEDEEEDEDNEAEEEAAVASKSKPR
jgi:hypothetical protein